MGEAYIFRPQKRVLVDLILALTVFSLFVSMFNLLPLPVILMSGSAVGVVLILLWLTWINPTFKVVIRDGKIEGPSGWFGRRIFPLRKINHTKMLRRTPKQKLIGYRNLFSLEGQRIVIFHRLLGKIAAYEILELVEKYPFRESPGDPTGALNP